MPATAKKITILTLISSLIMQSSLLPTFYGREIFGTPDYSRADEIAATNIITHDKNDIITPEIQKLESTKKKELSDLSTTQKEKKKNSSRNKRTTKFRNRN